MTLETNVCVQVPVGYVSRGPEGGSTPSASAPTPPLSLSLVLSRYEPHLCRHGRTWTTTTLHDSLPARCASSTPSHTGKTDGGNKKKRLQEGNPAVSMS